MILDERTITAAEDATTRHLEQALQLKPAR